MKWLKNNSVTIVIFLLGLAFSTGILWMKVDGNRGSIEDLKGDVKIVHDELHQHHESRPLQWPKEEPEPK